MPRPTYAPYEVHILQSHLPPSLQKRTALCHMTKLSSTQIIIKHL
jgi:hypothetical protein